jgi:hypothetical protein
MSNRLIYLALQSEGPTQVLMSFGKFRLATKGLTKLISRVLGCLPFSLPGPNIREFFLTNNLKK